MLINTDQRPTQGVVRDQQLRSSLTDEATTCLNSTALKLHARYDALDCCEAKSMSAERALHPAARGAMYESATYNLEYDAL